MTGRRSVTIVVWVLVSLFSCGYPAVAFTQGQPQELGYRSEEYGVFLDSLPKDDIRSIRNAADKFKALAGGVAAENDTMFLRFRDFFYSVVRENNDKLLFKKTAAITDFDAETLLRNGVRILTFETGRCFGQRPSFFCTEFQDYLSVSLNAYNKVVREELLETGDEERGLYLFDDLALRISWDQLADRIVRWEAYLAQYPESPLGNEAEKSLSIYISVYTTGGGLENTPVFRSGMLLGKMKTSYERFIANYPQSQYCGLIKDYYAILRQNDFLLTRECVEYLKQRGINTKYLEEKLKR